MMPETVNLDTNNNGNNGASTIKAARYKQLQDWLQKVMPSRKLICKPLAGDASFRHYYRASDKQGCYVVMDAPPDKEHCDAFIQIATALRALGVCAPEIIAKDQEKGFLLLSDFGDQLYLKILDEQSCDDLYRKAFNTLLTIQCAEVMQEDALPMYDEKLYQDEMALFVDWYLVKYKKRALSAQDRAELVRCFALLVKNAHEQPAVFVHRDFHSRNLLLCGNGDVGVLDFQDAVWGPVTYDLVSLLRDCYIQWPEEKINQWVAEYYDRLVEHKVLADASLATFHRWFDLMGLQRHLKCVGIFSRLHLRDQKSAYLQDIPRVLDNLKLIAKRYPEFSALLGFL